MNEEDMGYFNFNAYLHPDGFMEIGLYLGNDELTGFITLEQAGIMCRELREACKSKDEI
jgi:hypothetical protein